MSQQLGTRQTQNIKSVCVYLSANCCCEGSSLNMNVFLTHASKMFIKEIKMPLLNILPLVPEQRKLRRDDDMSVKNKTVSGNREKLP